LATTRSAVAICGSDEWLRHHLSRRLSNGVQVRDIGSGTSYLNGVGVLVIVPHLAPRSGSGPRDVAMPQALHTVNTAQAFGVARVVLVSRIGTGSGDDTYLSALEALEHNVSARFKKLTIVRLAHPFGPPDDPGPLLLALSALDGDVQTPDTPVEPIHRDDAVEVVAAAVIGRFGSGVVEAGGPERMRLGALTDLAGAISTERPAGFRRLFSRRGYAAAVADFVAAESVARREYSPSEPRATRRVSEVWAPSPPPH
jgi:hypothetical protein